MGMNPCQYDLLEMRVVHAALSCFSGPPSCICCLVLFQFGDRVLILPGSGMPMLRCYALSERDSAFWCGMGGELGNCFLPLGRAHKHRGWGSELPPCLAKLSLGRGFVQASCCPRRKAICTCGKGLTCILFVFRCVHVELEVFPRDRQFGIGTPQGGLAMTTALKAHLSAHPDHVVACLDFKNAFGTIDRTTCIQVLRELCPHHPAWLDAVNVLLSEPALVVNPERNHLAMTYDGLPQGDPLSTLVFSLSMTEVLHKAVRKTTSEVTALSYIDDTVLVGPADDVAQILQDLPRALAGTGLSLQPQKTQLWAPDGDQILQHPQLRQIQSHMKAPAVSSFWERLWEKIPRTPIPWATRPLFLTISEMSPKRLPVILIKSQSSLTGWKETLPGHKSRGRSSRKRCHPGWCIYYEPTQWSKRRRCVTPCKMPWLTLSDSYWANLTSVLIKFTWPSYRSQLGD